MKNMAGLLILIGGIFYSIVGFASSVIADDTASAKTDLMQIDFGSCVPGEKIRIDVDFGSTTYQIVGPVQDGCVMRYGGEVENPEWNGFLNKTCTVPISLGLQSFKKGQYGVDFSTIQEYCADTPQTPKE